MTTTGIAFLRQRPSEWQWWVRWFVGCVFGGLATALGLALIGVVETPLLDGSLSVRALIVPLAGVTLLVWCLSGLLRELGVVPFVIVISSHGRILILGLSLRRPVVTSASAGPATIRSKAFVSENWTVFRGSYEAIEYMWILEAGSATAQRRMYRQMSPRESQEWSDRLAALE